MTKHLLIILIMTVFMCIGSGYAQSVDDLILMTEEFPPYNFLKNGKLQGTSVDLMEKILEKLGSKQMRKDIQVLPWARSYKTLQNVKNTVLFVMTKTKSRENLFKWVGPISLARNVIIAQKNRQIEVSSIEDIKKYKVGVISDDAGEHLLINAGISKERLEITYDAMATIRMLLADRIDLFAYDENVTRWLMKKQGLNIKSIETVYVLEEGHHYFAFNKHTSDKLINAFQKALDELKTQGEFQKILDKYFQ